MNANELRIGNWVEANSPMMQVKEITEHTVGLYMPGSEADPFLYDIEEIRPIKLSPEILEKCGFEIDGIQSSKNQVVLIYEYGYFRYWYNKSVDGFINIRSLHQLQNLYFSLCGEELTYKQ